MLNSRRRQIGPLNCTVVEAAESQEPDWQRLVILCHGYGAPGDDLVGLAQEIWTRMGTRQAMRFLFPEAPIEMDEFAEYGGRAWWPISIQQLAGAAQAGDYEAIQQLVPHGLDEAREMLQETVEAAQHECKLGWQETYLGGFSQGSMLATDLSLRLEVRPAELLIFSGNLIHADAWRELAAQGEPLRVFQSHGRLDPILPFPNAEQLRDLLRDAGHDVEFLAFPGPHTIPLQAIERIAQRWTSQA